MATRDIRWVDYMLGSSRAVYPGQSGKSAGHVHESQTSKNCRWIQSRRRRIKESKYVNSRPQQLRPFFCARWNIVFATNNLHKLEEISALLGEKFQLLGLKDLRIEEEIPEDHETLEENASQKAWYIYKRDRAELFCR